MATPRPRPRFFLSEGDPPSKQAILRAALKLFVHHGLEDAVAGVIEAFLSAMDEDLEAVLFVQDALRELWPRLSASARRRSILRELRLLVERGVREGAVTGYRAPEVPVAALVGLTAQFGRMLYFGEVASAAGARAEFELAMRRMLQG